MFKQYYSNCIILYYNPAMPSFIKILRICTMEAPISHGFHTLESNVTNLAQNNN